MDDGTLETTATADLLRRYATAGATGCLRLGRDHDLQAQVYFREGLVYAATAPGAVARLGDRLVGAGHITEDELASTLEHQRTLAEPRRIGELLIERGLIDRETLRSVVREQSTDSVAVTLGWQHGTWAFTEGEEVPEDVPLDMSAENLLMEGARRLGEWEVIQARIGSVDAVPDFTPRDDTAELALTPDEWSMLTRIDGQSSIAEIAEESGYSEFEAGRIIYGLLTAGIVTLTDDEAFEIVEGAEEAAGVTETGEREAAFDPGAASELFGELGFDEDVAPRPAAEPEPGAEAEPEPTAEGEPTTEPEPAAGSEPAPDEPPPWESLPAPEREPTAPGQVNRNELMREFAALDDPGGDEPDESAPKPPPPPRPTRPRHREEDEGKEKRKGLFGRLRRD